MVRSERDGMNRFRLALLATGFLVTCLIAARVPLAAQEGSDKKSAKSEVSVKDRQSAMNFATENHPELARLLEQLEKSRPGEFARAMKELNQQVQRLENVKEKSAPRYTEQLEAWKRDSQIRVQIARWSRSQDAEQERQIRELLTKRRETRVAQLQADQKRLSEQLARVNEQLATMSESMESQVEKEWEQLSKKAAAGKKSNVNKSSDPAVPSDQK